MKFDKAALLDRMERSVIVHMDKVAGGKFVGRLAGLYPWVSLQPHDAYPRAAFVKVCRGLFLFVLILYSIVGLMPFVVLWYFDPGFLPVAVFHHGRAHALLIGLLSKHGIYLIPYLIIVMNVVNFGIQYPNYYFWNRRAARLRRDGIPITPTDDTAWPPAPTISPPIAL